MMRDGRMGAGRRAWCLGITSASEILSEMDKNSSLSGRRET